MLVLLPAALLLAGVLPSLLPGLSGRLAAAVAAWAAAAVTVVLWGQGHGALELAGGTLGAGTPATFHLDSIAAVCSTAILVPGAAILTWRPGRAATRLAALAAAQLAVTSADLMLTAIAAGAAFALAAEQPEVRRTWTLWAGVVAAAWAGAALQSLAGTATYGAAPAAALNAGMAGLLLVAAVLFTGALPVAAWPRQAWLGGSPVLLAAMPAIGTGLLFRLYVLGDGHLPGELLNGGLAIWAVLTLLATAWRAQAAAAAPEVLGESVPHLAGFGLLAAAAGGALGGVALALVTLSLGLLAGFLALADPRRRRDALLAAILLAAFPGTLGFGACLLSLQALVEGQPVLAFAVLPAVLAWLLWLLACVRLPGLVRGGSAAWNWPAAAAVGVSLLAGAALAPLVSEVALPAARDAALAAVGPRPAVSAVALNPVSGGWPALAAVAALVVLAAAGVLLRARVSLPRLEPPLPAPPAWRPRPLRLSGPIPAAAVERALSGGRPVLWGVLIGALAVIANRITPT